VSRNKSEAGRKLPKPRSFIVAVINRGFKEPVLK